MTMKSRISLLVAILAAAIPALGDASALPSLPWNRSCADRPFITVSLARNTLEGDLDGKLALGTTEKVFYIPKLDPGFGLSVGYGKTREDGLWIVMFTRSHHSASFRGGSSSASCNAFDFGGKGYLWTRGPILPYLQVGFGMTWLHVPDSAERDGSVHNANYLGLTVNGGGGLLIPLGAKTFLTCGASYHYFAYMYAKGPGRARDVTNLYVDRTGPKRDVFLKVPGLRFEVGINYLL
jgi:hypothetical protein